MRTYNSVGSGAAADSGYVAATVPAPGAIASITAAGAPGKITVSWSASKDAATYNLARQKKGSTAWTSVAQGLTSRTFVDTAATYGVEYCYRVRAYNSVGSSAAADSGYAIAAAPAPGAIASIAATGGSGRITVSWSASKDAATYNLARQKKGSTTWTSVAQGLTSRTFTDTTVTYGVEYCYRVRAYNSVGSGAAADSGYAIAAAPAPGEIGSVTATPAAGKITVTWSAASNAQTYRIARQEKGSNAWTLVGDNQTSRTFTDPNTVAGKQYRYTVRAYNAAGSGGSGVSDYVTAR